MHDEVLYRAWGEVTPQFWTAPAPGELATEAATDTFRARLIEIASAAESGRPHEAVALAVELENEIVTAHGEAHLHTVQVREVRGYLAALTGDHTAGLTWYLHCARARASLQGRSHPDVTDATFRAFEMWRSMPASDHSYLLGQDLLAMASDIHGADSRAVWHIRRRLHQDALPSTATPLNPA